MGKYQQLLLVIIIFSLSSCFQSGEEEIDFTKKVNTFELVPKNRILTTSCRIVLKGELDCDATIRTRNTKEQILKAGKVNFAKNYECYDKGIVVTISSDSCTTKSNLTMGYTYTAQYFGQK